MGLQSCLFQGRERVGFKKASSVIFLFNTFHVIVNLIFFPFVGGYRKEKQGYMLLLYFLFLYFANIYKNGYTKLNPIFGWQGTEAAHVWSGGRAVDRTALCLEGVWCWPAVVGRPVC